MARRPCLLVVDDDPAIREGLCEELAAAGYDTLAAPDGERAHALFRRLQAVELRLERLDHRRRLAHARARLVAADERLRAGVVARRHRGDGRWRTLSARLDSLSPLAVLGRGYALCWADDGRTLVRESRPELVGHDVRVTLARGELQCRVTAAAPGVGRAGPHLHEQDT